MSRFGHLEFDDRSASREEQTPGARDAGARLDDAEAAFRRGDFEPALRAYGRVLETAPDSAVAWCGQVRMLIELGEFAEAGVWADKALERFPTHAELLAAKAVTLARSGDTAAALTFSDAAIAEQGDTPYVWLARGDVLLARAEKRAEYCFSRALSASGGDWLWVWLAARIHYYYRKFSLALKLATQALAIDGAQAAVWLQLGHCQLALGLANSAQESYHQARELNPSLPAVTAAEQAAASCGWYHRMRGGLRRWLEH